MAYGVTDQGFQIQPYQDTKDQLKVSIRASLGTDVLLADTSDLGKFCALLAERFLTLEQKLEGVVGQMTPDTSSGAFLLGHCAILGITAASASASSVLITVTGVPGTVITNGVSYIDNVDGIRFYASVTVAIPASGVVLVTFVASTTGPIVAAAATMTAITGMPAGTTAVTNLSAAELGAYADTDPILRAKRRLKIAAAARSHWDALYAGLLTTGASDVAIYENRTMVDDTSGRPGKSYEVVTIGGNSNSVAAMLWKHSPVGIERVSTALTYTVSFADTQGVSHPITAGYAQQVPLYVAITITVNSSWSTTAGTAALKAAMVAYVATLGIGDEVNDLQMRVAIEAVAGLDSITVLTYYRFGETPAAGDYALGEVEYARLEASRITLTV